MSNNCNNPLIPNSNICKNPFAPKKAPPRKTITISPLQLDASERAKEFGLDYHNAYTRLEDHLFLIFDPKLGDWKNGKFTKKIHFFSLNKLA